jgi:hypothetical protein
VLTLLLFADVTHVTAAAACCSQLLQGAYFDYAGQWAATHTFTGSQSVANDATLKEFKQFVLAKQQSKEYRLEALYEPQLDALEVSGTDPFIAHA